MHRLMISLALLGLGPGSLGCGVDDAESKAIDAKVDPSAQVECGGDTPVVSWETFGEGFLTTYCQSCHGSTVIDRNGAPEDITLDTEENVFAYSTLVLNAVAGEGPEMPPDGGPDMDDRERLSIWLNCFKE